MTEEALQRQIVTAYHHAGLRVLVTSRRRRRCWKCGAWPKGGDGVTKGCPDVFCWRPGWWGRSCGLDIPHWRPVEVKGDDTSVSPEQQALADEGGILIARTLEEALAVAGVTGWEVR